MPVHEPHAWDFHKAAVSGGSADARTPAVSKCPVLTGRDSRNERRDDLWAVGASAINVSLSIAPNRDITRHRALEDWLGR